MVIMKESTSDRLFVFFNTLILCTVAVIAFIPLLSVIALSFSSRAAADLNQVSLWPVQFTFASWQYILSNTDLWRSYEITLFSTLVGTCLALLITALMAYPLSKKEFKIGNFLMVGVIVTMIFKAPIVPYFLVLRNMGLFNNLLVLILPHVLSAYNLAIMRTFFKQFPVELEEAAMLEGCGHFRLLFKIVLPSSKAVLATLGLFYAVAIWNQFQHPLLFLSDTRLFPLQLKIRQMINDGSELSTTASMVGVNYNERTLRSATVLFAISTVVAVYPYIQKYFVKGAMLGSLKG